MKDFSYITNQHPQFIENLYNDFKSSPESVDPELRKFFEGFDFAMSHEAVPNGHPSKTVATAEKPSETSVVESNEISHEPSGKDWLYDLRAYRLILGYRNKGHLLAKTNPIRQRKDRGANIELSFYGFEESDLDKTFQSGKLIGLGPTKLRYIFEHLKKCYAHHVGWEFKYISDQVKIDWLTNEIERKFHDPLPLDTKRRILEKLNEGVMFEKFLHTKYIGQKRFSLEGGETTIAALDQIITTAADLGVQEVVIGMAHRGRLNILANIMGKTYEQIFSEFEGTAIPDTTMGSGDVKYHLGFGSQPTTASGKIINLKLAPNPSHLEAVNPVVLGFARAKADAVYNKEYDHVLPVLIHGDASIAGQGIVYEVLQMSKLDGFSTGGTIHFIINNQIGFTTDFTDARSSDYCTSLAAAIQAPVFHVNGDDAEAVVKVVEIATRYRQEFNTDVFVDMVCYRKHGHNEGDDPKFTQPGLYAMIEKHPNPREVYVNFLLENGKPHAQELAREMEQKFWDDLQERLDGVKQKPLPYQYQKPEEWWREMRKATEADFHASPDTAVSEEDLMHCYESIMSLPEGFKPLRKVAKLLADKQKLFSSEKKLDWATGELLAYATICKDGYEVRMSGQDVGRGTFSHRHSVLRDEETDKFYNRLSHISEEQGRFRIYNSLLSEYGVVGFEYGYAMANPHALVVWEAQFGDFANGAQTMIDQFISSSEQKWGRMNGLVLLLPHGYEGQGPEHSSGRMERFLQMCAELNMIITNVTTAANLFHLLRRQVAWPFRKPLINFSPKANLRLPASYSPVEDFIEGRFQEVIDDKDTTIPAHVTKVIFCSGKIYFDLMEKKNATGVKNVAVVRLEQIHPLPMKQLTELQRKYSQATWFWVQEEPLNMGAASFLKMNLNSIGFGIISRNPSAATATGYSKVHSKEQQDIVETAFSI